MSVTGLPYTATLHRFTQHNHRFTKHKFFISLKAFLELKKILDWDTSKCCYKDIAKYPWACGPWPGQVPNQELIDKHDSAKTSALTSTTYDEFILLPFRCNPNAASTLHQRPHAAIRSPLRSHRTASTQPPRRLNAAPTPPQRRLHSSHAASTPPRCRPYAAVRRLPPPRHPTPPPCRLNTAPTLPQHRPHAAVLHLNTPHTQPTRCCFSAIRRSHAAAACLQRFRSMEKIGGGSGEKIWRYGESIRGYGEKII